MSDTPTVLGAEARDEQGSHRAEVVSVTGVAKAYGAGPRAVTALHGVSLSLWTGEFVSIVGPSGCGKSTLLHMVGGFVPRTAGSIRVHGREVVGPGRDRGMMLQDLALFPWKSVEGNVAWGLEVQGVPRDQRAAIVERFLAMVGLLPFRKSYPHQLSGGMKQRVALARVLAFDPEVLLMDEPFSALDVQTRELMQEELNRIWERTRKTVLLVTHDIEEAVYLSDRVLVFTACPGTIKREVAIDLPRPRVLEVKKTTDFLRFRNELWDLLHDEVMQSVGDYDPGRGVPGSSGAV